VSRANAFSLNAWGGGAHPEIYGASTASASRTPPAVSLTPACTGGAVTCIAGIRGLVVLQEWVVLLRGDAGLPVRLPRVIVTRANHGECQSQAGLPRLGAGRLARPARWRVDTDVGCSGAGRPLFRGPRAAQSRCGSVEGGNSTRQARD
jgi:hypothetical protein